MVHRLILPLFGLIFAASLAVNGCALVPVTTSEESSPMLTRSSMAGEDGNSISSLEAMRRGQLALTPDSSPLKDIFYNFDQYDLRSEAREMLKRNADWLKANPSVRVEIEGHADERGTNEYNLALGAKRAQSSKDYLISLGIPEDRMNTVSYGEEAPACREPTEDCWQTNRRDRFVIVPQRPSL